MACFLLPHHIPDPRALSAPCLRQTWESLGDGDNLWSPGPYLQPSILFEMTLSKLLRVAPQTGAWSNWNHTSDPSQQRAPQGCQAGPRARTAPSALLAMPVQASPDAYLCWRPSDACAQSLSSWLVGSHPNAHHLVILPNVWSYSAICLSTRFPGPHLPVLHPISCFGISLFISDPSGVDSCSSDI